MAPKIYHQVGVASLIMMASVFLSRVIGLLREMAIAAVGGADASVDAYQISFILPEILNHVVASGFLSVTFIPIFSKYLIQNRYNEAWRVFSVVMTCFGTLLCILVAVMFVYADTLVGWAAPGIKDPAVLTRAVRMTRIIIPAQLFFFTGGMFMAVQFSQKRFFIPALTPLIYNASIIAGGLLFSRQIGMEGFSWGALAGAFIGSFLLQAYGAAKVGMRLSFNFDFRHPELRKYILITLPLMFGLTMTFSTEFFLKFFGSYLSPGSIAALNYAFRVMMILAGLFGQALGAASFPFMAGLAAEKKIDAMNDLLNRTLRYLAVVIPFSVLFMVLRHEIVLILFQRGRFDAEATALTSSLLVYLMTGAFAFSAQTVVVRAFYATQDTLFPSIYCTAGVALSIPLFLAGIDIMGAQGLGGAISMSVLFQVILLYVIWNRRSGNTESADVFRFIAKMAVISVVIGAALETFRRTALAGIDAYTFTGSMIISIITGCLFLSMLFSAGAFLKIPEIQDVMKRVLEKLNAKC